MSIDKRNPGYRLRWLGAVDARTLDDYSEFEWRQGASERRALLPYLYEPPQLTDSAENFLRAAVDRCTFDAEPQRRAMGLSDAFRILGRANPTDGRRDGLGRRLLRAEATSDHHTGHSPRSHRRQVTDFCRLHLVGGNGAGEKLDGRKHYWTGVYGISYVEYSLSGRVYDCRLHTGKDQDGLTGLRGRGLDRSAPLCLLEMDC